jgi:predicted DsbA family dithiol-disulfide isomerase
VPAVRAVLWSDYICPWCYLGQDRTALLRELGVEVDQRAFDLHPETPPEGRQVRPGGRLESVLARIGRECADAGLPFVVPGRLPRSRLALETAEVVRTAHPSALTALDARLFRAVFVEGGDISDPGVVHDLVTAAGAPADEVAAAVADGVGTRALEAAMAEAREAGVAATPSWLVDGALLIPGALPRDQIRRWVERMRARTR